MGGTRNRADGVPRSASSSPHLSHHARAHFNMQQDASEPHPIQIEVTSPGNRMADTKVIRTFANEVEAYVAQAVLDANGIDSQLIRDDAGGMMPWLQWLHPIRLMVLAADSELAIELLDTPPGQAEGL